MQFFQPPPPAFCNPPLINFQTFQSPPPPFIATTLLFRTGELLFLLDRMLYNFAFHNNFRFLFSRHLALRTTVFKHSGGQLYTHFCFAFGTKMNQICHRMVYWSPGKSSSQLYYLFLCCHSSDPPCLLTTKMPDDYIEQATRGIMATFLNMYKTDLHFERKRR